MQIFDDTVPIGKNLGLTRTYMNMDEQEQTEFTVGDLGIVELSFSHEVELDNLRIQDYLPAGLEVVNIELDNIPYFEQREVVYQYWEALYGQRIWAKRQFTRDGAVIDLTDYSRDTEGESKQIRYVVRASFPGTFTARSGVITTLYFPDMVGYTQGEVVVVK